MGADCSGVTGAILANVAMANGMVMISPSATSPALTKLNGDSVEFFVTSSGIESDENITVFYNKQTADNARGDFEDQADYSSQSGTGRAINIPEIDVQLRSETIAAKTRKLKAQWTPEFAQDLNAYQALDAEAELTSIMSEYISLEIDLEILDSWPLAPNFLVPAKSKIIIAQAETVVAIGAAIHP